MSAPFGKEKSNNIYFNVANGEIAQSYPEPESGCDGKFDYARGVFTHYNYYHDEGNPSKNVEPGMRVDVWLATTMGIEPMNLVLRGRVPNTYSRMLASHLPNIAPGDTVRLRVWPGTDNAKVTVCMVDKLDPETGAWFKVPRVEMPKSVPDPRGGKPDTRELDARTAQIFETHPAKREKGRREPRAEEPVAQAATSVEYDPFADE